MSPETKRARIAILRTCRERWRTRTELRQLGFAVTDVNWLIGSGLLRRVGQFGFGASVEDVEEALSNAP